MAANERRLCHLCAGSNPTAQLSLGSEARQDNGQWVFVKAIYAYGLCERCHHLVAAIAQGAASSLRTDDELPLGVPGSQSNVKRSGNCDYCDGELGDISTGLDIVPDRHHPIGRVSRKAGSMFRQRLCPGCTRWWVATFHDPTAITGHSRRALEGESGGWIGHRSADVLPVYLSRRDTTTLERTLVSMGTQLLSPTTVKESEKPAFFVRAGRRDRARSFVTASRPRARRCVVVAAFDSLEDARQALLAGAADLLAEPLTPNQIAGALDRLGSGWALARDSRTGIPVLGDAVPASFYGLPATDLSFGDASEPPLVTYLSLRRMLRGFDYVGFHDGAITARVYASPDNVPHIVDRLSDILGVVPGIAAVATQAAEQAA